MRFRQYGKTCQLRIDTPEDLENVLHLDESLWVATSAPVSAFRCDPRLLELLDTGKNGRIRTAEVKQAVAWLLRMLSDTSRLAEEKPSLFLSAIRSDDAGGVALLDSARYVLKTLGADAEEISLGQVRSFLGELKKQPLNGDGVIVPGSAQSPAVAGFIEDAVAATGGTADAGGEQGVTKEQIDQFLADTVAYLDWQSRGTPRDDDSTTEVLPFGARTPELYDLYVRHAGAVDDFFALCRMARFAPQHVKDEVFRTGLPDALVRGLDETRACLAQAPIAPVGAEAVIPLGEDGVNPAYEGWLEELARTVVSGVLGSLPDRIGEADWNRVRSAFAPYAAYLADKKGSGVEKIPLDRLRSYRSGELADAARALIERDRHVATILEGVLALERLLLYHENLLRLANNFVNFSQLYSPHEKALFEMGALVMDGRWFNFAVRVSDVDSHRKLAGTSNLFTLYLEVTEEPGGKSYHVAVPATSGSRGNLVVGKRGVFFDIHGRPYDARVTHIIENPISLREALVAPFSRLWRFLIGKIEAMSTSSEKDLQQQTAGFLQAPPTAAPATAGQPASSRAGLLVGLSLSAAAVGSAFAFVTKTLAGLEYWQILAGILGGALAVGIPVSLIAIMKLRRQDLSSLLEGCGWAINARMRPNVAQRRQFTRSVAYPAGASGLPRRRWVDYVLLVVTLAIIAGAAYHVLTALAKQ